jgi:hypothetical protein
MSRSDLWPPFGLLRRNCLTNATSSGRRAIAGDVGQHGCEPWSDEGRIFATLRITDDEDARAIARRILELYHGLDRFLRER